MALPLRQASRLVAALALAGCSLMVSDEDELGRPPRACAEGTMSPCPPEACDGAPSVQRCMPGGQYGECRCPPAAGNGG